MNINYFRESLEYFSLCGISIDLEKAALIENSLIILQSDNKFKDIFFWGCINGLKNDYYIAYGYLKDCIKRRRFFYSLNCYEWLLLPVITDPDIIKLSQKIYEPFTGDLRLIATVKMDPKFTVSVTNEIIKTPQNDQRLKEEDRLACIVNWITQESAILPRGALYKYANRKVKYNPIFKGLSIVDGMDMTNFMLYRRPQNSYPDNLMKRHEYNYTIDFLDTIDCIHPDHQSFAITIEKERGIIFIKSLYFLGMIFFHKCHSKKHGFCYFGNGLKNLDLPFMF